jgi:hypothetical protein
MTTAIHIHDDCTEDRNATLRIGVRLDSQSSQHGYMNTPQSDGEPHRNAILPNPNKLEAHILKGSFCSQDFWKEQNRAKPVEVACTHRQK